MGILNEMFGDEEATSVPREEELLAAGDYVSEKQMMLGGYNEFRKRYAAAALAKKLVIAGLALASAVFMIISSPAGEKAVPFLCLGLCVFVIGWFIGQFVSNKKNYLRSLESLVGIPYHVEIYSDKIKISDMSPIEEKAEEVPEETEDSTEEESSENPTTIIHLDSPIVDLLDDHNKYIIVVKKAYVFIIPKSAFTKEENSKAKTRFCTIMGIRFKCIYMPSSDEETMKLR